MWALIEQTRRFWREHFERAITALLAALTLFCYGFALRIPFFHDDLPIMTWLRRHGWRDIWFSQENGYYRPLAFTVYKAGTWLPLGARQVALHAVNVALLWASGVLIALLVRRSIGERVRAALAGVLLVIFPFLVEGIPWITALSHPLVLTLTLLATYAALRADDENSSTWWAVSLTATALAPLAHESGAITGVIVGGVWLLTRGFRPAPARRLALTGGGVLLNVAAVLARFFIPGAHTLAQMQGLQDLPQNFMYFLQGLLYPVAPFVQVLVTQGGHDFTLLSLAAVPVAALVLLLVRRGDDGRWVLASLWWWVFGALPAAASLRYGGLFVGARLYTLASAGIVMFWAGLIIEVRWRVCPRLIGQLLACAMALLLIGQNVAYLRHARRLYDLLDGIYAQVLDAAEEEAHAPLGFVNVPSALTWEARVYPLVTDNVVFVPGDYTNILEFIQVNVGWGEAHAATYGPLYVETDPTWLGLGPWLEGEALRTFVLEHETLWLGRYDRERAQFVLDRVGHVTAETDPTTEEIPQVHFEGGSMLLSTSVHVQGGGRWQLALEWQAAGPVDGTIFVHVVDQNGVLVAQDDGAALGGLFPLHLWREEERVHDLRYVTLPDGGAGPYSVRVGLYNDAGRFPAFVGRERSPDDAPTVSVFSP